MILRKLQKKLRGVHCIERSHLAEEFNLSSDGVDAMLALWVNKGQLKRTEVKGCDGCNGCGKETSQVIYEWLDVIKSQIIA